MSIMLNKTEEEKNYTMTREENPKNPCVDRNVKSYEEGQWTSLT